MSFCTRILITDMMPNGMVTGVKLLDISAVEDGHEFGLSQEPGPEFSPVTGRPVTVYQPILHIEGLRADLTRGDSELQPQNGTES
jgi:hypothetical protein